MSYAKSWDSGRSSSGMPAGLDQIVGETGWQLSQGERSRVFLARALLQDAELIILDESLAALDPENLQQCLECVLQRAIARNRALMSVERAIELADARNLE